MKRVVGLVAIATVATVSFLSSAASAVPTAKPMLGTKPYPGAVGFGEVRPTRLGVGKDAVLCHIHWDAWGGQIAVGTGVGFAISPKTYKPIPSAVVVYLYKLMAVHGKPAYTAVNFVPVPTQNARSLKAC